MVRELELLREWNDWMGVFLAAPRVENGAALILQVLARNIPLEKIELHWISRDKKHLERVLTVDAVLEKNDFTPSAVSLSDESHPNIQVLTGKSDKLSLTGDRGSQIHLRLIVQGVSVGIILGTISESPGSITQERLRFVQDNAGLVALAIDNVRLFDEVTEGYLRDDLTQLSTRRHFKILLEESMRRAQQFSMALAFAAIDIDHFKKINDSRGHRAGDIALQEVARSIQNILGPNDCACRQGGDELLLAVIRPTEDECRHALESLLTKIRAIAISSSEVGAGPLQVTVSMGAAFYPKDGKAYEELIASADSMLYKVKAQGRNGLMFAGASQSETGSNGGSN